MKQLRVIRLKSTGIHSYCVLVIIVLLGATFPRFTSILLGPESRFNDIGNAHSTLYSLLLAPAVSIGLLSWFALVGRGSWWQKIIAITPVALLASALWAELPARAVAEGGGLLFTTFAALGVHELQKESEKVWFTFACAVFFPLMWSIALSASGKEGSILRGDWQGIYANPNHLAGVAAVGTLVAIMGIWQIAASSTTLVSLILHLLVYAAVVVAGVACVLNSGGTTAQYAIGIIAVLTLVRFLAIWTASKLTGPFHNNRDWRKIWPAAVFFGIALYGAIKVSRLIDWSFTRRTERWSASIDGILQSPFSGWGFQNAWFVEDFRKLLPVSLKLERWSHSSWLDIALALGVIPAFLVVMAFLTLLSKTWINAWRDFSRFGEFTFALLGVLFMTMESLSFVLWYLYALLTVIAARTYRVS